jgi:hypothetical protein
MGTVAIVSPIFRRGFPNAFNPIRPAPRAALLQINFLLEYSLFWVLEEIGAFFIATMG